MKNTFLKYSIFLLGTIGAANLHAQFSITGKIIDSSKKGITTANVLLLLPKDSSLVKGVVSNSAGNFQFTDIADGSYLIACSFTGYKTQWLPALQLSRGNKDMGEIELKALSKNLSDVTITAKKPLFEQRIDRMVVNVKNSITSAGGTVLDVLQKSPGVMVNKQGGTISMGGKDGVQVMINGKLSYMPANALINMLDGMSANNVERIELITTPPAKYDAGGNAGYINIVMQQSPDLGFNGSYSLTTAAFYGTSPAANFDFNYRTKKTNLYGSYSFSRKAQTQDFNNFRKVSFQGKTTETLISSTRDPAQLNNNVRLGLDYQLGKKTTLGILAAGYNNRWTMDAINKSATVVNAVPDTAIKITNDEVNQWKHGMGNINLQHNLAGGGELSFNTDYLYYNNKNPTDYLNQYYNGKGDFLSEENTKSGKETTIKILPIQLDYKKKLSAKADLEAGLKTVFSKFTNDVRIERLKQGVWQPDNEFTNKYFLKENIAAAYASLSIAANANNSLKAGLRYEYTYSNLGSVTKQNIVDRKYGKLFPTVYWSHKINDNNTVNFSYNRRINRPTFNNLAPFLIFMDPNTFISGNAALQPSIADGIKVDYVLKRYVFSIGYTYEKNTIADFQTEVDASTNKQYTVAQNLTRTQMANATLSLPLSPTKWWFLQINLQSTWQQVDANYLKEPVRVTQLHYNISGFQSFTLPKDFSAELSGFFQSPSLFGIAKVKPYGLLNIAVQKKFVKSSSAIKFGVDDLFSTMRFKFSTDVPAENYYAYGSLQFSRRIFKLTFSQSFGNKILKDKRARETASEAERARVQ